MKQATVAKTDDVKPLAPPADFALRPKRVALVAVDWYEATRRSTARTLYNKGFDPFWGQIAAAADAKKCDAILYALWSHDVREMPKVTSRRLFGRSTGVQTVILESDRSDGEPFVEVWRRDYPKPHRFQQHFGRSRDAVAKRRQFIADLPSRTFGKTMVMVCGESNIVRTTRDSEPEDEFGFRGQLDKHGIRLLLNPGHDYMRRFEMKEKRKLYSERGRCVLTVWNRGNKPPEVAVPWYACMDGVDVTDQVAEIGSPTKDIRIGIFDCSAIWR